MKTTALFLLIITCGLFLSLDNFHPTTKLRGVELTRIANRIGVDTALALIAAYDSTRGVVTAGKYLTKSVYFDFNILKNAIDTLISHASSGTYNANNFGYRMHFAKYDDSNTLIRSYLNAHSISSYGGRNTLVLELKYNQQNVTDVTGQKIYLNLGDMCPNNCP